MRSLEDHKPLRRRAVVSSDSGNCFRADEQRPEALRDGGGLRVIEAKVNCCGERPLPQRVCGGAVQVRCHRPRHRDSERVGHCGEFLSQASLAHTGRSGAQHELPMSRRSALQQSLQTCELHRPPPKPPTPTRAPPAPATLVAKVTVGFARISHTGNDRSRGDAMRRRRILLAGHLVRVSTDDKH